MVSVPSPFGGDDETFDPYDSFVPAHLPDPGAFLAGHDVLGGRRHLAVHRLARALFEERAVYDMTFGYNLARLNVDTRHRDAGFRYAVEDPDAVEDDGTVEDDDAVRVPDDARVLRAEFWPTTPFCPQSDTLTKGAFRAFNGLGESHEFDLVRVRVAPMHQRSAVINEQLRELAAEFRETGEMPDGDAGGSGESAASHQERARSAGRDGSRAPF